MFDVAYCDVDYYWKGDVNCFMKMALLKVLGKSVGLCKSSKRKDHYCTSVYLFLYGESFVKISTQTDSY